MFHLVVSSLHIIPPLYVPLIYRPLETLVIIFSFLASCPAGLVAVEAHEGMFVEGHVTPALADITISLAADGVNLNLKTDTKGKYK